MIFPEPIRSLFGVCFGAGVSFFNFFLLKKWAMRLGNFQKPTSLFLFALFCRYLFLFFGIWIIVQGKWTSRWAGLAGLFGMYIGLLAYEFAKLKKSGD